jgi:exodeoxyribonuclease VII large subunit
VRREADRPRLGEARRRLAPALDRLLGARAHRLELLAARIQALDPSGPLERGFVLVRDQDGRPLTRADAAPAAAVVALQWRDGARRAVLD